MIQEILKIKIDFDALEKWRDADRDDLPIVGFVSLYKALGIVQAANDYKKDHPDFEVIPLDNIFCNLSTHRRLKSFIENNWQVFSIDIDRDYHVFWDTSKYAKGKKHYAKKMKAVVRNAVSWDFASYAPGLDEELGVNEIVLGISIPEPTAAEEAQA